MGLGGNHSKGMITVEEEKGVGGNHSKGMMPVEEEKWVRR
jgi:hypothetical protein